MNSPRSSAQDLRARIAELTTRAEARAHASRRKQKVVLGLGTLLVFAASVSLTAATKTMRQLDTDTLAQIGRQELEDRLPDGREAVQDYLRERAPDLVADALESLVHMMPRLRRLLVQDLTDKIDSINTNFEDRIVAQMGEVVHASRQQIDQQWPDATVAEKLQKLVQHVAGEFNTNVTAATLELYPQYRSEMSRITSWLSDLASKKPEELSADDRQRKEIIETLLRLIMRERNAAGPGK